MLTSASARETIALDTGWKFFQGDDSAAVQPEFDDSKWQPVNLPHDWSIAGPFAKTNLTGGSGGFLPSGVAWYRKHFSVAKAEAEFPGRPVLVEFDGVMQNSDVWINGFHLGHRPNGYVSFDYELTSHLNPTGDNVLVVRADTSEQPASRWYSGAGIYRHVRLVLKDEAVRFAENRIFISTPEVSATQTLVRVQLAMTNADTVGHWITAATTLLSPKNKICGTAESSFYFTNGTSKNIPLQIAVPKPQLWNLDDAKLYRAVSKIICDEHVRQGIVLDEATNTFGIRSAEFTADRGFALNGKKVMLKGVCIHHDGGAFGAAVPLAIWEDRLNTLKTLGVNAIRCAHNPPAPEFLDLCDRMGFLVMDEFFDCWTVAKKPHDYHLFFDKWAHQDERDTILRDRNHPSVIIYSAGNEILDTPDAAKAKEILSGLVAVAHEADPTRPVTQALFRPNKSGDYTNGLADLLDVIGTNYRDNELLAAQRAQPARKIVNTEQKHARESWLTLRDNPSLAGQFLWTGVDYLGEARSWPRVCYAGGLLDRTGLVKPSSYERQSWWSAAPMVRLVRRTAANDPMPGDPGFGEKEMFTQVQFNDWTPKNSGSHDETVEAYSNCDEVELFLNGKSLGTKKINADASPRSWKVPFAPGSLKAVAKNAGKIIATDELRTAGKPAAIKLETKNPKLGNSWDDVAIVRAFVVDADGVVVPRASDLISFSVSGAGAIAAVDNGDNDSAEPFQAVQRRAFHGDCVAYIKAVHSGKIQLMATAVGLKQANVKIVVAR